MRYIEIISSVAVPLTEQELAEAKRPMVPELVNHLVAEFDEAPYQINNGECEEFAERLAALLGPAADVIWADNLCKQVNEGSSLDLEWDVKLITLHWPQCYPTHGLDWADVRFEIPAHAWVIYNDLHYDAECPEGVYNFFKLPLIDRGMARIAARKAAKEAKKAPSAT